jgi:putative Holliday junction resolvase
VVGLPLDRDGGETDMSRQARQFGQELQERTDLPVYFMDERLTSQAVESNFAAARAAGARRRKDAALKDAMAAKIILENWLQSLPATKPAQA